MLPFFKKKSVLFSLLNHLAKQSLDLWSTNCYFTLTTTPLKETLYLQYRLKISYSLLQGTFPLGSPYKHRQQLMEIVAFAILHDSNSFKSMVVLFLAGRNVTLHKMAKLNRCRSKLFYSPSSGFRYWLTSLMSFTSDAAIVSVHIGHTVSPDSSKLKTTTTTTQTNMFSLIRDYHRTAVPTVGFRGHTMWRVGQSPRWQYPVAKFIFCSMPKLGKKYAENENLGVGVLIKKRWRRRTHKHFPPHQFGMQSREGAVWTHAPVLFRHMSTLW